ncbi:glycosyltransferase, partial [Clostridia bacterium OttesenSCG-928-F22]|nr:glycosyltransferase [Clostridia bacterium OttesenSCG-928-F22]
TRQHFALGDEPVFLFVGQMIRQKNILLIAEALAKYKAQGGQFKMIYVGEGQALSELRTLCTSLGLDGDVLFTGRILDRDLLKGIYLNASLFLFPSLYDNAPLVVREAASMGVPTLFADGSNAAEGVVDGENGFLTAVDAASIAQKLHEIMATPNLREQVGMRALKTLAVSWDEVLEKVYRQYLDIIADFEQKKSGRAKPQIK